MKNWFMINLNWIIPLFVTSIFSAVNVIFAVMNAKNAKHQKEQAEAQVCLSLMEKRVDIYYAFRDTLSSIIGGGDVKPECLREFCKATQESDFLFGEDIAELKNNISQKMAKLLLLNSKISLNINTHTATPNHMDLCNQELELINDITKIRDNLANCFRDYLDLSEYKIPKTKQVKK